MARVAAVLMCGVVSVAVGAPPPAHETAGGAATTASQTPDEKSAKWIESFRRDLMQNNYDYQTHAHAHGPPRRAAGDSADASDQPANNQVYRNYEDRYPVPSKMTRTITEYPEKRAHHAAYRPVGEVDMDYVEPEQAQRAKPRPALDRPGPEDYADAVPARQAKQSRGYPAPARPANEAQEYANAMPEQGKRQAMRAHSHPAPARPHAAPDDPRHPGGARRPPPRGAGRPFHVPEEGNRDPAPASLSLENNISRQDLYGPVQEVLQGNGSLTDEEFEARRRDFLESLYELEDQLTPVYVAAPSPGAAESRRGVTVEGQMHARDRDRDRYQYAALPGHPGAARTRLPPARGLRAAPHAAHNINHAKSRNVDSFTDPRDGIRRYKVRTDDGQLSNIFGGQPRYPPAWDEAGVYDGAPPERLARPVPPNINRPNGGDISPSRAGRPPIKGDGPPYRVSRPPASGRPPKRVMRDWGARVAVEPSQRTTRRPKASLPAADEDDEPIYRDREAEPEHGNEPPPSQVWNYDGPSAERPSAGSDARPYSVQVEYMVERRAHTGEPHDDVTAGRPARDAARRSAELLGRAAEPPCACLQNTTHTPPALPVPQTPDESPEES